MTKPKYDLEDLAIFATYDGVDAHTNFVAEVADSALDVIRGYEHEVERLQARVQELEAALAAVRNLINNSEGVAGLHLNGDVAPWDELLKGGEYEGWLGALAALQSDS